MKNRSFHFQLRKLNTPVVIRETGEFVPLTVAKIAEVLYMNRQHLTDVLNNKAGCGTRIRPKVIRFFKREYPSQFENLIKSLGWNESGEVIASVSAPSSSKPNVGYTTFGST